MPYLVIRLYRRIDSKEREVREDLERLEKFVAARSGRTKDAAYIALTGARRGSVRGLLLVESDNEDVARNEGEVLLSFIKSSLSALDADLVDGDAELPWISLAERAKNFL
ncbi:MAG: hypothetical protein ABWK00_04945 [Desulfurococcaceae archaeon]